MRTTFDFEMPLDAPPAAVFPLLCPVREYDWIEGWQCQVLHSLTGIAEDGCIFTTELAGMGRMTWVVSRYEPVRHIEFVCFADGLVMRLKLEALPDGTGTKLLWKREYTALTPSAAAWLAGAQHNQRDKMMFLWKSLERYLAGQRQTTC